MADIIPLPTLPPATSQAAQVDRANKTNRDTAATAFPAGVSQSPNGVIARAFANASVDHGPN